MHDPGKRQISPALGFGDELFGEGEGFYSSRAKQLEFLQTMHLYASYDAPIAVRAFDLTHFKTACDLGGGECFHRIGKLELVALQLINCVDVKDFSFLNPSINLWKMTRI